MTITEDLVQLLRAREQQGIVTYGQTLTPFNGRDATQDALEEALDLAQYLRQWQIEREAYREVCKWATDFIERERMASECETLGARRDAVLSELRRVLGKAEREGGEDGA